MSLIQVATQTITSATASVTLTGIDTTNPYLVTLNNITTSVDNIYVQSRVTVSGTAQTGSNYQWFARLIRSDTTFSNQYGQSQTVMRIPATALGNNTNENLQTALYLYNFFDSNESAIIEQSTIYQNGSNNCLGTFGGFTHTSNQENDGIHFYNSSSANFLTGTFTLYKVV